MPATDVESFTFCAYIEYANQVDLISGGLRNKVDSAGAQL